MPDDNRRIIWGEPGQLWTNDGERPLYQFVATLQNTCGACLQYHMAIGAYWPIPIHRRCRCKQFVIRPGATAPHASCDFRELLDGMTHANQVAAVGASNYALLRSGVVTWAEVVTKYRVRTLREVIALHKISLETALQAGVRPAVAKIAYGAVHTPEAEMIRQHRAQLTAQIVAAGVPHEKLVEQVAATLSGKVEIVGSSGVQSMANYAPPAGHASEIAAILAATRAADLAARRALPTGARVIARDGEVVVRVDGRDVVVRPGETAFGIDYEQLRRIAR